MNTKQDTQATASPMLAACFNRFVLDLPAEAVPDCSHSGACDEDVKHWAAKIARPAWLTVELLRAELKDYGAWDAWELSDDPANWLRIVWIAAGNISEERKTA